MVVRKWSRRPPQDAGCRIRASAARECGEVGKGDTVGRSQVVGNGRARFGVINRGKLKREGESPGQVGDRARVERGKAVKRWKRGNAALRKRTESVWKAYGKCKKARASVGEPERMQEGERGRISTACLRVLTSHLRGDWCRRPWLREARAGDSKGETLIDGER
ncbi:hypothetical protein EDB89DRAFT_1904525 [Lactarius sanguifluus]|nr:hypothetical protein EDB89DRAFT_1904525 [Lactarius sanguifluus]